MLLVQFRVLPCTFHHAAVFLNGIAAWQTHGAATQERRCKAFRLVSQKQNQISCNSRVLYSKCFLLLRFVLSDVISVGQRITWPAAKANTKTKTRLKFIAVKSPRAPRVIHQTHTQRGHSTRLIRNPKWKQLIKVGGSRAGQGADKAITHCALHAHTHHGAHMVHLAFAFASSEMLSSPSQVTLPQLPTNELTKRSQVAKSASQSLLLETNLILITHRTPFKTPD